MATGVQRFVVSKMGERFVKPPVFDLNACFDDSTCATPLVFILSPGSDPMGAVLKAADGMGKKVRRRSLPRATTCIKRNIFKALNRLVLFSLKSASRVYLQFVRRRISQLIPFKSAATVYIVSRGGEGELSGRIFVPFRYVAIATYRCLQVSERSA